MPVCRQCWLLCPCTLLSESRPQKSVVVLESLTCGMLQGFYVFIRAVQQLVAKNTGTIIVGLADPLGRARQCSPRRSQT